jgi:hypothetical protein
VCAITFSSYSHSSMDIVLFVVNKSLSMLCSTCFTTY